MATIITSDSKIPIEESFKVSAGPGAGKTHWLVNHIKQVLAKSKRLGAVKKIACITYTNVGTDTIYKRLQYNNDCVDVTTIHSFLYANVVKPYVHLIANTIGLQCDNISIIDDSNYISIGIATKLLSKAKKRWIEAECYCKGLHNSRWHYNNNQFTEYKPKRPHQAKKSIQNYYIPNETYVLFKHDMWNQGLINYDDILYISWLILNKYPNLYTLLRAKYPYIYVDEFQDTIPFVNDFLLCMREQGTTIGVVGDKAQSIYGFIGATAKQFDDFKVPKMQEYEIRGNRRSTIQIIDFLNLIRTSFTQIYVNGERGEKPVLIVGDKLDCYQKAIELCHTDNIKTLAFQNILANSMRNHLESSTFSNILEDDFDSNTERQCIIKSLIKAVEYAKLNDLRSAWHQLDTINTDRTSSIIWLRRLLQRYDEYRNKTLMDFYNFVSNVIGIHLPSFREGQYKSFYLAHNYLDAAMGVKYVDANIKHKTIHKSKGEEFDNVFIILPEEKDLEFIIHPDLDNNETHRVYYVGCSRARKRLFINVPTLNENNKNIIASLPIDILD